MAKSGAAERLTSPLFLDELHHLLWVEPGEHRGQWDEGWSCRNHALIAAAVACALKERSAIVYGKAMYVQGPQDGLPPVGVSVDPHAWFGLDGSGYFDLSPRLTQVKDRDWRPWPLSCVAMSRCVPWGEFRLAYQEREFEDLVNSATHIMGCKRAVYFGTRYANLSRKVLNEEFSAADAPLTVRLASKHDPSLFAQAAVHLCKLLKGEVRSLRGMSQDEAWETISQQPGDAIGWICMRGGLG
jgi:hypothetical protein